MTTIIFVCLLEAILSAFLTAYCDILPHLPDIHPRGKDPKSLLPVLTWWLHIWPSITTESVKGHRWHMLKIQSERNTRTSEKHVNWEHICINHYLVSLENSYFQHTLLRSFCICIRASQTVKDCPRDAFHLGHYFELKYERSHSSDLP